MKIGVVGLGLMGGSFVKAIKEYGSEEVYGFDKNDEVLKRALKDGSIDDVLTRENITQCDLVVLALMPGIAIDFVKENHTLIKGLLLDFCGVKREVERQILPIAVEKGFSYMGGHPMAGREVGGYEHSSKDLYQGASMILVENETSRGKGKNLEEFFYNLGFAQIKYSDSSTHDRVLAYTSQLAHVVSNSFVQSPTHKEEYGYSADSLKDLTRVATLDVDMWTELFFDNKDFLYDEVMRISDHLSQYARAIKEEDETLLKKLLSAGCIAKREMEERRKNNGGNSN
ncbi:MAG: prephenate dehydrogenase [Peptoniphilus sp.]|nr:prephenate dehydrogenase [Peptoniphilus sp.]